MHDVLNGSHLHQGQKVVVIGLDRTPTEATVLSSETYHNHLGARLAHLVLDTPAGERRVDSVGLVFTTPEYPGPRVWCVECRRRQEVIDRHDESAYEGGSGGAWERHFLVEDLECGHSRVHDRGTTNTAPGGLGPGLPRSYELGAQADALGNCPV